MSIDTRSCITFSVEIETSSRSSTFVVVGITYSSKLAVLSTTDTLHSRRYCRTCLFRTVDRYIVNGPLPLVTIGYRRLAIHKGPLLFKSTRSTYAKHIEHPFKNKYVSTKACPELHTTRSVVHGDTYPPYIQRYCHTVSHPDSCMYVIKYPEFYQWETIPKYLKTMTIHIYSKNDIIFSILTISSHESSYHLLPERIDKIQNNVYKIRYQINNTAPLQGKVTISIYVRDRYGNFLDKTLLW